MKLKILKRNPDFVESIELDTFSLGILSLIVYIRMMKFFISIMLFLFYCITPFQSNAGVFSGNKIENSIEKKTPVAETQNVSFLQPGADLLHLNQQRSSNVHFNYPAINKHFNNGDFFYQNLVYNRNNFLIPPFLYCKSIGLILIFPEHYFF